MLKLGKSCILRSTGSYLTANEPSLIIFNFMHTLRSCNDHQLNGPAVSRLLIENLSRILTISSLRCPPLPSYLGSKTCFCIIVGFSTTDLKVFVETRGVLWWWDEGRWRPWNLQTVSFGWGGGRWGRGVGLLHLNSPTLPSLTPAIVTLFLERTQGGWILAKNSSIEREK